MIEEWRPVVNYEERYEVSNFGRVKTLIAHTYGYSRGSIRKLHKNKYGYFTLCLLSKNGIPRTWAVHQLVMRAFIGPPPVPEEGFKIEVNHKDDDKSNNHLSNLEYISKALNVSLSWNKPSGRDLLIGENHGNSKLTKEIVLEMRRLRREENIEYVDIGNRFNVSGHCAWSAINGRTWKHLKDN